MLNLLPRLRGGLMTAGAVLLVLAGAYGAGSRAARRAVELNQTRERLSAMEKAREVEQTVDALDDTGVRNAAGRWVRGADTPR